MLSKKSITIENITTSLRAHFFNILMTLLVRLFCLKEQFEYGIKGIGWMDHIFLDKRCSIEGVFINQSSMIMFGYIFLKLLLLSEFFLTIG